jgi:hypothetical protein
MANKDFQNGFIAGLTAGQGKEIVQVERTVQVDWLQEDSTQPDYIKNKPNISGGTQVQANWDQDDDTAADYIKNKPFYIVSEGSKLILPRTTIEDGEAQFREIKFNSGLIANETYDVTFKLTSVNSDESYSTTIPMVARQWSDILREMGGTFPEGFSDFIAFYFLQFSIDFEGYGKLYDNTFILCDKVTVDSLSGGNPVLADGIASYALIDGGDIPEGYEFTAEIDDGVETVHKLDTKFINTTDKISESVTNEQVPTAKAVYDYVKDNADSGVDADWTKNDPQGEGYIKNRPFYVDDNGGVHKLDTKFLKTAQDLADAAEDEIALAKDVYEAVHELEDKIGGTTTTETINFVPRIMRETSLRDADGHILYADLALDSEEDYEVIINLADGSTRKGTVEVIKASEMDGGFPNPLYDTIKFEDQWASHFIEIFDDYLSSVDVINDKVKVYYFNYEGEQVATCMANVSFNSNGTGIEEDERPNYTLFTPNYMTFLAGSIDGIVIESVTMTCPIIRAQHMNADWEQYDPTSLGYIRNKPFGSVLFTNYNASNSLIYDNNKGQEYTFVLNDKNILTYTLPEETKKLNVSATEAALNSSYAENDLAAGIDKFRLLIDMLVPTSSTWGPIITIKGKAKQKSTTAGSYPNRYKIIETYSGNLSLRDDSLDNTGEDYLFYHLFNEGDSTANICQIYIKADATLTKPCTCYGEYHYYPHQTVNVQDSIDYLTGHAATSVFKRLSIKLGVPDVEYKTIPEQFLPESVKNNKVQCIKDWEENDSASESYIENRPFYQEGNAPFVIDAFTYGSREEAFGFVEGEKYKVEYLFDDNTTLVRYVPAISLEDLWGFKGPGVFDEYYYDENQTSFDNDNLLYFFLIDNAYVNDDGYPVPEEGKAMILVDNKIRDPQEPYKNLVSATIYVSKIKKLDTIFLNTVSEISENSSESEIPTAKSVYNYIDTKMEELKSYITEQIQAAGLE